LRPPCEIIVRSVLPAFRSLIARSLIENFNFSQVAAAKKLGTTQASISNYLYSKRGEKMIKQLEASSTIRAIVTEIAEGISTEKISSFDAMLHFCKLCEALKTGDLPFDLRKSYSDFPEICNVFFPPAKKR
jgi:predicted transcriptional regulator